MIDIVERLRALGEHEAMGGKVAAEAADEIERLRAWYTRMCNEIEQVLGKALGFPPFPDDWPGAEGQVCVGDHVPESLAAMIARRLAAAEAVIGAVGVIDHDALRALPAYRRWREAAVTW